MKLPLRKLWESRAPRERAALAALAIVTAIVAYAGFVQSAGQARERLRATVTLLRMQAGQIERQAVEFGRLRAAPALSVSQTSLQTLLQDQIGAAGLSRALVSLESRNADQVVIVFGAVAFTDWLKWLAVLKSQHVRVDACRIEALSTPGLVSVTATLVRTSPP